jgi:undecaprenyl-diphosphatase
MRERGLRQRVEDVDDVIFRLIAGWHSPVGDRVLPPLSEAASYSRLWMGIGVLIAVFGGKRGRHAAVEAAVAVGVTSALATSQSRALPDASVHRVASRGLDASNIRSHPRSHRATQRRRLHSLASWGTIFLRSGYL